MGKGAQPSASASKPATSKATSQKKYRLVDMGRTQGYLGGRMLTWPSWRSRARNRRRWALTRPLGQQKLVLLLGTSMPAWGRARNPARLPPNPRRARQHVDLAELAVASTKSTTVGSDAPVRRRRLSDTKSSVELSLLLYCATCATSKSHNTPYLSTRSSLYINLREEVGEV
jgi:hypothetical protein